MITAKNYFQGPSEDSFRWGLTGALNKPWFALLFIIHQVNIWVNLYSERYTRPSKCWLDWNLIFEGSLWGYTGTTSKFRIRIKNSYWNFSLDLSEFKSQQRAVCKYSGIGKPFLALGTVAHQFKLLHLFFSLKNKCLLLKYTSKIITKLCLLFKKLNRNGVCVWIAYSSPLPNDSCALAQDHYPE